MDYRKLTIEELHELLVKKETTPLELTKLAIELAKKDTNNAFERLTEEEALRIASELKEPEVNNPLWGIPFVIKDNFSTKDIETTASSNILNGYVPVFNATVVDKLLEAHAIPIGKVTLDELAMGGSGITGHKGVTFNPYDRSHERIVGGSSCGSAAAVADGFVPFALGSDTGDSVRKPASLAGLVGFKPTWSRISRFGLFPFAPSLDTVGYFTRSTKDAGYILNVLAGRDEKDATSSTKEVDNYTRLIGESIKGKKIAVINQINNATSDKHLLEAFDKTVAGLREKGAEVHYIDVDNKLLETLFPTYFVISCAEATSNNANLDGVKFGPYYPGATYQEAMTKARTNGFSELIRRRFVIGSYALMRENQNELFLRAQKNRQRIVRTINEILKEYDFIYVIAAPSVAPKLNDASDKLSDEYLIADNHLCLGNFTGLPSITIPIGLEDDLPLGANLMGRAFEEAELLQVAYEIENITGLRGLVAKEDK